MNQTTMFEVFAKSEQVKASPHQTDLQRVGGRIGEAVLEFVASREQWHADELRAFVELRVGSTAPGSADRILRMMRRTGDVGYEVVDRSKSLYRRA